MKKQIIFFFSGILLMFLLSSGYENYVASKQTANVNQKMGLYIFTDSKPVKEYEYMGTISAGITVNGYYDEVINSIIKRAKKDYPQAEGIIFISNSKAEVIKFK